MITPPDIDVRAGMEVYATTSQPCRGRLKTTPEDFRVEESLGGLEIVQGGGPSLLPLYRVEKRGVDTFHLQKELAEALRSKVSFAGMKDKRAVSIQYATPTSTRADRPPLVERESFRAELVGYVDRPISRGMVSANRFDLVIRDCCQEIEGRIEEAYGLAAGRRLPNFYGLQRFGGRGALTHRVGREIIKRRFEEASRILLWEERDSDGAQEAEAREAFAKGRYLDGFRLLPRGQDVERMVAKSLAERPDDPLWGLRAVPIGLRKLYTQAYQSYLFNRALTLALKRGVDISRPEAGDNWGEVSQDGLVLKKVHGVREPQTAAAVPLLQLCGYAYRNYGSRFDSCLEEAMAGEGISAKEFFVGEMQEVSVEGGFRRPHMAAAGLAHEVRAEVATLGFTLARGMYATVLVREIVKPEDPNAQGFA
ncbi:MAG TPA: tRNA pseudouridine(13) synthase TruD [Nitrososphaerales archaeon]|nr:tRNA pseudouridine(13) synthase TruD [Nitrososphaerales archaeon]